LRHFGRGTKNKGGKKKTGAGAVLWSAAIHYRFPHILSPFPFVLAAPAKAG
jgi:hypothetical protein